MKRLNVAVISAGGAGRAHIERFRCNPRSRVRAVFDPYEKNLRDFHWIKEENGYVTTEHEKILNDTSVDVVSICSPDHAHYDLALAAVKAGKHVLVEKPLVVSYEQCEKLRTTLRGSKNVFGVHHQMRYLPCFVEARSVVAGNEIGLPFLIEADYMHDMRTRAVKFDDWRMNEKSRQKIALGMLSHTFDLIRWVINDEVAEVFSYATHIGWPDYPDEDTVMTVLKFKKGAIGKVSSTIACRRPQYNSLVIYGTDGNIVNNAVIDKTGFKRFIYVPKNGSIKKKIFNWIVTHMPFRVKSLENYPFSIYEHDTACERLIDDFLCCVQEGRDFPVGFSEGAYSTQICLASIESYEKGAPVQVKRMF